ncbi:hypothetical protein AFM11_19080 [Mycolicibacterium wolinskyi]|uniref:Uncharacterized protein n=1 Tax=Mycolicibacterium wolinskyi TaxID=59750 RepID=A0A132PK84_9MYCO|nr:hypothetical protein AFM11_19080 [Mycolicibacterium wolinskyi]
MAAAAYLVLRASMRDHNAAHDALHPTNHRRTHAALGEFDRELPFASGQRTVKSDQGGFDSVHQVSEHADALRPWWHLPV